MVRKIKILFIHPFIPAAFKGLPIGLCYLISLTKSKGYEVMFLDQQACPDLEIIKEIEKFSPSVVAIASTSPSHLEALQIAREIRVFDPNIIIVKGGVHETHCATETIKRHHQFIDFALRGDCDASFITFLELLDNGATDIYELAKNVPGLVAYSDDTGVLSNNITASFADLDSLPYPYRPADGQTYNFPIFNGKKSTQVQTMRGCPFSCSFCNQRNKKPPYRSIKGVVEELMHLQEYQYEAVFFDDATFTVWEKRSLEMMNEIVKANIKLEFACQTRSELLSERLAFQMALAGFSYISFGLETADMDSLKEIMKNRNPGAHLNAAKNAVNYCRNNQIRSCLNLIVGLPGETEEKLFRTFEFVNSLDPDFVSLAVLAEYPHQNKLVIDEYEKGVNREDVWKRFDEGYGSVHPFISKEEAEDRFALASKILGTKLLVNEEFTR